MLRLQVIDLLITDYQGNTITSKNVYIPKNISRVHLDFALPVANNLKLWGPGTPNLWRNNNGSNYPYQLNNILSIKNNSAFDPSYYYYYYNWEIKLPDCASTKVPIVAFLDDCDNIENLLSTTIEIYPNPTSDKVYISLPDNETLKSIAIIDITGRVTSTNIFVNTNNNFYVDLSHLTDGIYLLQITIEDKAYLQKS